MREITKFKGLKPAGAEGRVCIDLKDPDTMKVKERIQGKNHVFEESLMSGPSFDWVSAVNIAYLCLNNTNISIDPHIPYLFGQTVGYGMPSQSGSGEYRGAYNQANQILAQMSLDSVFWRFQYDFTTAQANGTPINIVGLTHQYGTSSSYHAKRMLTGYTVTSNSGYRQTNDGRYVYSCSTAGVVTKTDLYTDTIQTIDISNDIGNNTSDYKTIGYSPKNGRYYVHVYSSTANRRKFYEYSDSTFNSLLNVYDISNISINSDGFPLYIYNNKAFILTGYSNAVIGFDFVNNEAQYTIEIPEIQSNAITASSYRKIQARDAPCPLSSRYIKFGGVNTSYLKAIIFDLLTEEVVGFLVNPNSNQDTALYIYPFSTEKIMCSSYGANGCNTAIAAYQLDTSFTKTSANAMTVTYELEVFW
jgi:hypothetical protein